MANPRLLQVLCGHRRHALFAIAYQPDQELTPARALNSMRIFITHLIALRNLNPWCAICRAPDNEWLYEDNELPWGSLEEAMPALRESERRQAEARLILDAALKTARN